MISCAAVGYSRVALNHIVHGKLTDKDVCYVNSFRGNRLIAFGSGS